jgi:hypothetical protein
MRKCGESTLDITDAEHVLLFFFFLQELKIFIFETCSDFTFFFPFIIHMCIQGLVHVLLEVRQGGKSD